MLGQHVYIEMDEGQEEQKKGIWLGDYYIVDADTENPYVWAVDSKGRLEKRSVVLGQHDDDLSEYEIADGLKEDDSIAFPSDSLAEGMRTKDVSEMTDEELEAVDMESNLDGSGIQTGIPWSLWMETIPVRTLRQVFLMKAWMQPLMVIIQTFQKIPQMKILQRMIQKILLMRALMSLDSMVLVIRRPQDDT